MERRVGTGRPRGLHRPRARRAVATGLDELVAAGPHAAGLRDGARVGLVLHAASVDRLARHAVDLLGATARFVPVRLFAPEHGHRGEAQDMEAIPETSDPDSGLPVVSLYGRSASSLRPRPEHLEGLDAIVWDLQDVGSRYYTFVHTLSHVMEAAAASRLPVVVLDRPNPIGGLAVEGPVLDPALASFVGRFPVPVRHGMTAGELARLFHGAFGIDCDLRVVPMRGYRRWMHFEDTGLPWVAPSPNMPSVATARVYPGGCLVEGTNLSEGRGTTRPFELTGAPWLDGRGLASALASEKLPGALFRATSFRPTFHKHAGESCGGVQVHVSDRETFRPFAVYLVLLREARSLAPGSFDWRREPYEFESSRLAIDLLLGLPGLREALEQGEELRAMEASWLPRLREFESLRRRFLLYPS